MHSVAANAQDQRKQGRDRISSPVHRRARRECRCSVDLRNCAQPYSHQYQQATMSATLRVLIVGWSALAVVLGIHTALQARSEQGRLSVPRPSSSQPWQPSSTPHWTVPCRVLASMRRQARAARQTYADDPGRKVGQTACQTLPSKRLRRLGTKSP